MLWFCLKLNVWNVLKTTSILLSVFIFLFFQAVKDCKIALENDAQSVKGYFFMGQSDVELKHYDDAIIHLTKGTNNMGIFACLND